MAKSLPKISVLEISEHNRPDDLWVVVDGVIYDMTEFAPRHPGGLAVLHRFAGRDASRPYSAVHAASLIGATLEPACHVGVVDEETVTPQWRSAAVSSDAEAASAGGNEAARPALAEIINLNDFEAAAQASLPAQAWAYVSTGASDNLSRDTNAALLRRVWLRPAVLRDVSRAETGTTLFQGSAAYACRMSMPVLVAPTGASRTGGPEGELALARGAAAAGIVQGISTVSSYPYREIVGALLLEGEDKARKISGHPAPAAFFQLYVDRDHHRSERLLRDLLLGSEAGRRTVRAIIVTVDLPVMSKREADERARAAAARARGDTAPAEGIARQTGSFVDDAFCWDDLRWLRSTLDSISKESQAQGQSYAVAPGMPILVKGIQTAADARRALDFSDAVGGDFGTGCCQGIVLSNHGGRAADGAPPALITLLEMHRLCPEVFGRLEVIVDGGFRRGADVLKAVCLGASAVGIGRPFVFSVGYGAAGVERAAEILHNEIQTAMGLCGLSDLMRDADPKYINTADIDHLVPSTFGHPYARKPVWPSRL